MCPDSFWANNDTVICGIATSTFLMKVKITICYYPELRRLSEDVVEAREHCDTCIHVNQLELWQLMNKNITLELPLSNCVMRFVVKRPRECWMVLGHGWSMNIVTFGS